MSNLFINGSWRPGNGASFQSTNPANGEVVWEGPSATAEDVSEAYAAAREAFPSWARTPLDQRIAILRAYVTELDKLAEDQVLIPGMPVEAFIRTADRSPLTYLIKPVADYFNRAFRES